MVDGLSWRVGELERRCLRVAGKFESEVKAGAVVACSRHETRALYGTLTISGAAVVAAD
jgi:hypothetical protein